MALRRQVWWVVGVLGCATPGAGGKPAATAASATPSAAPATSDGWSRRADRSALEAFIADRTNAAERDATNAGAWLALAEAHAFMGESTLVLRWGEASQAAEHFARAQAAALSALEARDAALASELRTSKPVRGGAIPQDAAAALYWYGKSLHARAQLIDHAERIAVEPVVASIARACAEHASSIDHGGAHRLLGELAAHPADASARDLAAARAHFERALAIDGAFTENARAFAEHYAIPAQDRAQLEDLLERARKSGASSPEDTLARARVESLTAQIEERFE